MPRNLKPDALKTGSGRRSPEKGTTVVLGPAAGMSSAVPNIGQAEWMSLGGQKPLPSWLRDRINSAGAEAVAAHLLSGDAHPASAISFEGVADGFKVSNVEEGLLDLHGAMPKEPPHLGEWQEESSFNGITDWGFLKTNDIPILFQYPLAFQATNVRPNQVYPYFYKAPSPLIAAAKLPFMEDGNDPQTDPLWNSGIPVTSMHGTNIGGSHVGAFTRDGTATGQEVMRTTLLTTTYNVDDDVTGLALRREVTISGAIYPADRGVLALIHWPAARGAASPTPTLAQFLAQPLHERCVAALLLGQGILGSEKCKTDACDDLFVCDGEPGGIFAVGVDADGNYDPFVFPGRATGQYDLYELHSGKNRLDNSDLKAPFPPAGAGQYRVFNGTTPAAGQVRLGTDPNAGEADPTGYGIPVLGAGNIAYDIATPPSVQANVNAVLGRTGHTMVGDTIVRMEDPSAPGAMWWSATNFFRYRLPYLKDYSADTGLKWTPTGTNPTNTRERFRFFDVHQPASAPPSSPYMGSAGYYGEPFSEDQITWQVARYRHSFLMPSTVVAGEPDEAGSYWLVHFKKEADFESFVRDGVMPWDATDGYEVYGVETYDTANHSESDANVVNEQPSSLPFDAPFGFAPDYGYVSQSYFPRRSTILLTPDHSAFTAGGTFEWTVNSNAMDGVVFTSGIAAFLPNYWTNVHGSVPGDQFFSMDSITINETTNLFFEHGFRTDETWLSGDQQLVPPALKDPALISSPSPATITFFSFAYGPHPTIAGTPSIEVPLDSDTGLGLSDYHSVQLPSRVEIPYTHMGPSGPNQYSEANGPQKNDSFVISTAGGNKPVLFGDDEFPSFVEGAKLRAFFRRPMRHRNPYDAVEPYSGADGHGIVVPADDGADILFHTTRFDSTNRVGRYGNFIRQSPADPTVYYGFPEQYTTEKDSHERFLDETYRYPTSFKISTAVSGIDMTVYGAAGQKALAGPGLQGYPGGPIEVPVRAGLNGEPPKPLGWARDTWLGKGLNYVDFNDHGVVPARDGMVGELQVRGWCDRNPPMTDRANAPYPSTGLLAYPKRDYSAVGSPDLRPQGPAGAGDLTADQPDYSGLGGERSFVRAFDVSSVSPSAAGKSFVHLRIDGCKLHDLAYHPGGLGGLKHISSDGSTFIAVLVKVPGLTTWMDVGRADGSGPSKQDAFLDGAGCQVVGPETFDGIDEHSGIPYCQIKCHVGPVATLFASTGIEGTIVGEVPVLVKVVMDQRCKFDMEHEYDEMTDTFTAVAGPGSSYSKLRGICGLRIVNTE